DLRMIEQEAVDRAVVVVGKTLAEPIDIEAANPLFALPHAAEEANLAVIGKQVHNLVVHAFVDQVAIEVLELFHVQLVLADGQALLKFINPGCQRGHISIGHSRLSHFVCCAYNCGAPRAESTSDYRPSASSRLTSSPYGLIARHMKNVAMGINTAATTSSACHSLAGSPMMK